MSKSTGKREMDRDEGVSKRSKESHLEEVDDSAAELAEKEETSETAGVEEENNKEGTATHSRSWQVENEALIAGFCEEHEDIGYPEVKPDIPELQHGWFYEANQEVIKALVNTDTACIAELGTWLGRSAMFLAENAPNATIFTIDLW